MIEEANLTAIPPITDVPATLVQVLPYALGVMAGAAAYDGLKHAAEWTRRLQDEARGRESSR
jgi:hypothetical protein